MEGFDQREGIRSETVQAEKSTCPNIIQTLENKDRVKNYHNNQEEKGCTGGNKTSNSETGGERTKKAVRPPGKIENRSFLANRALPAVKIEKNQGGKDAGFLERRSWPSCSEQAFAPDL